MTRRPDRLVTISIAGIVVTVDCRDIQFSQQIRERYQEFVSSGNPPGLSIKVSFRTPRSEKQGRLHGIRFEEGVLHFSDANYEGQIDVEGRNAIWLTIYSGGQLEEFEYFLRLVYALLAFQSGGFLFHCAGIVRDGRAYCFFGPSGIGKTTVARLSKDCLVLNDDLVLIRPQFPDKSSGVQSTSWVVNSTPFWNPSQVRPSSSFAPLEGLFRLVQSKRVFAEKMPSGKAIAELIANIPIVPADPSRSKQLMDRLTHLIQTISIYRLHFLPDASFWNAVNKVKGPG